MLQIDVVAWIAAAVSVALQLQVAVLVWLLRLDRKLTALEAQHAIVMMELGEMRARRRETRSGGEG